MIDTVHICVAMKPIEGNYASNALKHGVAGLNVDATRIGSDERHNTSASDNEIYGQFKGVETQGRAVVGRWPANVIHDGSDEVVEQFPVSVARQVKPENIGKSGDGTKRGLFGNGSIVKSGYYDTETSASRFFQECKPDDEYVRGYGGVRGVDGTIPPLALSVIDCEDVTVTLLDQQLFSVLNGLIDEQSENCLWVRDDEQLG